MLATSRIRTLTGRITSAVSELETEGGLQGLVIESLSGTRYTLVPECRRPATLRRPREARGTVAPAAEEIRIFPACTRVEVKILKSGDFNNAEICLVAVPGPDDTARQVAVQLADLARSVATDQARKLCGWGVDARVASADASEPFPHPEGCQCAACRSFDRVYVGDGEGDIDDECCGGDRSRGTASTREIPF